ncbi:hypothetical protein COV49_01110 [Candidatus Falkowbacteria bacterium CG11_big_fil_rev_8_21_14_0_20_39_10]|uniref:EamA domain-containing protein n=1 Tax=Candidatus Falkowbacteria bacterium CG11_big_fil_rev_8_21_14_0_20_39_10 TaxID=1974570 RepID=A0A2M6K9Z8_9BACT|nr:MAG: hypothetical protein COV49_01110 [Candidatus Falkowbacteria bacterium CG11_big_fil_rev_8_21_14_0_20_39_10]
MWLTIAITAYFINAGVYVADKFLLSKKVHSSITYTFYVGVWSIFNLVLLVFAPWAPNLKELAIDLSAGLLFLATLIFWYKALHQSEATRAVPIVGALVPIFSFCFSYIFLGEDLNQQQFLAFFILIAGGVLISVKHTRLHRFGDIKERFKGVFENILGRIHAEYRPVRRLLVNSISSALLFAAYYVLIKYIYSHQPFIGGFVWSRLGSFLGVILILLVPRWRKVILKYREDAKTPENISFFIWVRLFAALAFIMLNWAISLGSVALVNSLQGVQYLFLIFLVLFISAKHPHILKEELGGGVLMQKLIGVLLVGAGLYILIT